MQDVQRLKHYGNFNDVDSELLKGPVLMAMMQELVKEGKAATYKTLVDYVRDFRRSDAYMDFVTGVLLYWKLEGVKVNPANRDNDKMLFVRMGFTVNDLDDFKESILEPAHQQMTYKEAYVSYMKDFEALGR